MNQNELKSLIYYEPETGEFYRRNPDGTLKFIERKPDTEGYERVFIKNKAMKAHRLAFIYMEDITPDEVDHINHVRTDNRWCNLRAANKTVNLKNQSIYKNNKSGVTGVYWNKAKRKWVALINNLGKQIYIGAFDKLEDAVKERSNAEVEFGYHINHGSA